MVLNYRFIGFAGLSCLLIVKLVLVTVENISPALPESAHQATEKKLINTLRPTLQENTDISSPIKDQHKSGWHTEIKPDRAKKIEASVSLPAARTDAEKLHGILNAEYQPSYDDTGAFIGLAISSLPEAGLKTAAMDIQNGDIITQINDLTLQNEESFGMAVAQLLNRGEKESLVIFDFERNGMSYSMSLMVQP